MRNLAWASLLICAFLPLPSAADPVSAGITAVLTSGSVRETSGATAVPLRFEIFAEGVPPIGPVEYGPPVARIPGYWHGTKLSYANAVLRYRLSGAFSVGIGETLYNQQTTTGSADSFVAHVHTPQGNYDETIASRNTHADSSRVPGMRYELLSSFSAGGFPIRASLAVTPSMHALIRTEIFYQQTLSGPLANRSYFDGWGYASPESASEVEAQLSSSRDFGGFTLRYGLRYLNYIARYDGSHALADRDTLLLPFVGVEHAIGK